jgi:ubiquinone/menaquinone biosynthesis C-methylase UbiE
MRARFRQLWGLVLRFGFRLLYQEMAWSYDAVSWLVSFGEWRAWQRSAIPYIQGSHVLEIGHGPGHMLLALHQAGYQAAGIDLSPQMGAISHKRLRRAGLQVPLLQGKAQNLPFAAKTFNSVLATFPAEFIVAEETLTSVHRVLSEDGRFIIVPQAIFTGSSLPERFIEWLYQITGQRHEEPITQNREIQVTKNSLWDQLRDRFENAGFMVEIATASLERSQATIIIAQKRGI